MANALATPQIIAREALLILKSNTVFKDLFHQDYSNEFVEVGDTVNVRKPASFTGKEFTGNVSVQDATEAKVPVKLDRHVDVTVQLTSKESTLELKDFVKQIVEPAILAITEKIDQDCAAAAISFAKTINAKTANPTNLADIAGLAKALDISKAPMADRSLVFHPQHKYDYALTDNLSKVSYAGDNQALRDAILGKVYSLNTYMDQNCIDTTATTAGTATNYKVVGSANSSTVALSSVSPATGTVKAGDGFVFDGKIYRFTEDGTAASSAIAEIDIDKPLHKAIAATDEIKLINKPYSVAFQKNGIAFVSRPLSLPEGAAKAYVTNANGLNIRVVFGYNTNTKTDTISFDVLYGIAKLNENLIVGLA